MYGGGEAKFVSKDDDFPRGKKFANMGWKLLRALVGKYHAGKALRYSRQLKFNPEDSIVLTKGCRPFV